MKSRRIVSLFGEINGEMFATLANQLMELVDVSSRPITLLINSDGGDVDAAIAIFDFIKGLDVQVDGCVVGLCHSSALIVLQACRRRFVSKNSSFMLHEGSIGAGDDDVNPRESAANAEWNLRRMALSTGLLASKTHLAVTEVTEMEKKVSYLTPEEAIVYGFADSVVDQIYPKPSSIGRKRSRSKSSLRKA
jgi:ATP-dependent Clp protease protease subunit